MIFKKVCVVLVLIIALWLDVLKCEPVTMTVAAVGAVAAVSAFLAGGICLIKECCTDRWISTNFTGKESRAKN